MEQRNNNFKKVKVFTIVVFSILLILLLVIGGIAMYDVLGNGYDLAQTKEHLTTLGLGAWSWILSAIGMISTGGLFLFSKFLDIIDNNKGTIQEAKAQAIKVQAFAETTSENVKDIKRSFEEKMTAYDNKQITMVEILDLLTELVYDPILREKIMERLNNLREQDKEGA